jgi:uncharacterized protein YecE (DUF72 family)
MKQSLSDYDSNLRIGTCSWKYDSWKGLIYEAEKDYKPYDYLQDYVKHYTTVEIDQWFWSLFPSGAKLPNTETVKIYTDSVPDDFLFTIKAPNAITLTHHYAKQSSRYKHIANQPNPHFLNMDLLKRFLDTLQAMESKLGPVMFQFEYLNRQKMPSLNAFIEKLSNFFDQAPKEFEYAVEIRNPNYLKQTFFKFLKEMSLSPILLEGYYMPPINKITGELDTLSDRPLIIRLMGPDRQKIEKQTGEKWDRIVAPKDESLDSVANMVEQNIGHGRKVFVNVNNHYEGCAVLTIERLMNILQYP